MKYKCKILRNLEKEKPLKITINNPLCCFLVNDGDQDGGKLLAAAYQNFIEWQNKFLEEIITKNSIKDILNSYASQLEQEISVQDATIEEIIYIGDDTFNYLNELIISSSMRNIFTKDQNINYMNYNDIIYKLDYIE